MRKSLTAMKKLELICKDTENPNFASNYQTGIVELLKESIVKSSVKTVNEIEQHRPDPPKNHALNTLKQELIKLYENTQIKEECARVEAKTWNGVSESKFQYQRGREIMAKTFGNKCDELIKKIDSLIKYL